MKILITELQKKAIDELQWLENSNLHIENHRIPMTPKIYQLISGKERIRVFHISDVHKIIEFGKIRGTKKTISAFTYMNASMVSELQGIQTRGGVLYEIFGDLVIHSPNDIMSRPDENGIRWIDEYELFPPSSNNKRRSLSELIIFPGYSSSTYTGRTSSNIEGITQQWNDAVNELFRSNKVENVPVSLRNRGKERTSLYKQYFLLAEKFIAEHAEKIKQHLINRSQIINNWNEILVNNIEIHDVFWTTRYTDIVYDQIKATKDYLESDRTGYQSSYFKDKLTEKELDIANNYPQWLDSIQKKLESIATGKVYKEITPKRIESGKTFDIRDSSQVFSFIRDRGGFVDPDEYRDTNFADKY